MILIFLTVTNIFLLYSNWSLYFFQVTISNSAILKKFESTTPDENFRILSKSKINPKFLSRDLHLSRLLPQSFVNVIHFFKG